MTEADKNRFWEKVQEDQGCWLWTASCTKGYGKFWYRGKYVMAHRFLYEQLIGKVEDNLELDHLCRRRNCVNPDHLEAVSHLTNVKRGSGGQSNRHKTQCPKGHVYDQANTYHHKDGSRQCRTCRREKERQRRSIFTLKQTDRGLHLSEAIRLT